MKTKGITFWEQHVEHFVLGGALIFLLVFVALQVIRDPNSVEERSYGKISPGEVDEKLREKAEEVGARLTDDAAAPLEIPDPQPIANTLKERLEASLSPVDTLLVWEREVKFDGGVDDSGGGDVAYVVPEIPAPHTVVVRQDFDALDDAVIANVPALAERFPDQPYDVSFLTIAGMLPLDSIRDAYAARGPNDEEPIPANWYGGRVDVLDVRIEREELIDGEWQDQRTLDVLPGLYSLRERIAEHGRAAGEGEDKPDKIDGRERDEILEQLRLDLQGAIIQPEFYALKQDSWLPPDPRAAPIADEDLGDLTEEQREIRGLERRRRELVGRRQSRVTQGKKLGCDIKEDQVGKPGGDRDRGRDREREAPGRSAPGRRGGGGDGGRRAPSGGGPPPGAGGGIGFGGGESARDAERDRERCERLQAKVRDINRKIKDIDDRLIALRGEAGDDSDGTLVEETMDDAEIRMWAFDIWAEAGHTYRYRFVVDLYNPFFARRLNLMPEQHALADQVHLASVPSEWSAPKTMILPMKVFITKAYGSGARGNPGRLGMGTATAEVYRFYSGRWWMETFNLEPGDRVGAIEERRDPGAGPSEIDYGSDWFVLDILSIVGGDADKGHAAEVWLQSLSDPSVVIVRDPRRDTSDLDRDELRRKVREADNAVELAQGT